MTSLICQTFGHQSTLPLTVSHQPICAIHRESELSKASLFVRCAGFASSIQQCLRFKAQAHLGRLLGQQEPPRLKRYRHHDRDTSVRCWRIILTGLQYVLQLSIARFSEDSMVMLLWMACRAFPCASGTVTSWMDTSAFFEAMM